MNLEASFSLRLPAELCRRADALVPLLAKHPEYSAVGSISRAAVLRLAFAKGLAVLEAEFSPKPKK